MSRESFARVDNYIQEEIFGTNLHVVPTKENKSRNSTRQRETGRRETGRSAKGESKGGRSDKGLSEIRIPPLEIAGGAEIKVIRNSRRRRSISAYREHGSIVIQVPARLSNSKIQEAIPEMIEKILAREAREKLSESDLLNRANRLIDIYLPEFTVRPASVNWRTMNERWGSCTTVDRTIRISDRLSGAPDYVLDYLLVHELIHLEIADHGESFRALLSRFTESERANAFLEGYEAGAQR